MNFGGLAVSNFGLPDSVTLPSGQAVQLFGATGLQSYGLGIPTTYIQGIGQSNQPFDNDIFAFFAQDSWRVNRKLTLNYGVRYDVELTPLFAPATDACCRGEKRSAVDGGNSACLTNVFRWRIRRKRRRGSLAGAAGRLYGVRASYGLFYSHRLLAIAV